MHSETSPPANPAGPFEPQPHYSDETRRALIEEIAEAPARLRQAVEGLTDIQLDTRYKNWTVRQIVHHIADSHVHSYVRFKWTLAEERPTIKAYEEADWVMLEDARHGDVGPSLALVDGLHTKWVQLLLSMTEQDYAREFHHPQTGENVSLWTALNYYPWHARHHTGQIFWLREKHEW